MVSPESRKRLRFFGIEFRIVFCLFAFVFVLIAWASFKSSLEVSLLFFILGIFSVLLIWLDYAHHWVSLTSNGLVFGKILWRKLASWEVYINWSEVEKVTTRTNGFFNLLKSTKIEGKKGESFKVFSFMEDYLHFLKDVTREAKSAQINKLTVDLLAGRADV
jgi:DNA modification methylase